MQIAACYKNQSRYNGALERMIWGRRDNGTMRALGVAAKTRYGTWEANCDNLRGGTCRLEARTLRDLMAELRTFYP